MRSKLTLLAAVVAAFVAAGGAIADNPPPSQHQAKIRYSFMGQLTSVPSNGGVSITVEGGNKAALRAMLGAPVTQTFDYGSNTEFLRWSDGIPTVVQAGDLATGDYVWVHVRAARGASLADIESQQAGIVGDHGATINKPDKPLYLFRGTLTSVQSSSVTVHLAGGNGRALRLLLGGSADQTFAFGDSTIFLLWQGKVPSVIDAAHLKIGDKIVVRIRADKGSTLAEVESTAAAHIGDREPAAPSS
ncbi:MAG TPA: hypothetical protein VKP14_02930 [Gaiellaceae bacterium]|nr:hypothetical protein [Gaiellaceae bacterium]